MMKYPLVDVFGDPLPTVQQTKVEVLRLMRLVPPDEWSDRDLRYAVFAHSIGYRVTIFRVKADGAVLREMRTRKWHPCAALQMYERYMHRRYGPDCLERLERRAA